MRECSIGKMQNEDIVEATKIWTSQYERYCGNNKAFPDYWGNNTQEIEDFLKNRIEENCAIVAKLDNKVVGYMAYFDFPFHGENSVFCPIVGHSAVDEYKENIYLSMYKSISHSWIQKDIFNHMWGIFYHDMELRRILFDLGYGSYVIDSFGSLNITSDYASLCQIRRASQEDISALYELVEESKDYYQSAPLFLKRDTISKEEISEIINKSNVFIAWDKQTAIGFINVSIAQENSPVEMFTKNCGLIDEIGAYIKLEYRNKNIGRDLLKAVSDYCVQNNITHIHVDHETANLYANKFWRKYFDPMILSVRRTVNKDANRKNSD